MRKPTLIKICFCVKAPALSVTLLPWENLSKILRGSGISTSPNTRKVLCISEVTSFCFQHIIRHPHLIYGCCVRWTKNLGRCLPLPGAWPDQRRWHLRPEIVGGIKHYWTEPNIAYDIRQRRLHFLLKCPIPKCF